MTKTTLILGLALFAFGCDSNPKCDELAEHMTGVLASEKGVVPDEAQAKSIKDIKASCNAHTPPDEVLECALKAKTRAALVECDALVAETEA